MPGTERQRRGRRRVVDVLAEGAQGLAQGPAVHGDAARERHRHSYGAHAHRDADHDHDLEVVLGQEHRLSGAEHSRGHREHGRGGDREQLHPHRTAGLQAQGEQAEQAHRHGAAAADQHDHHIVGHVVILLDGFWWVGRSRR
jgi:hypothetical protein